MLKASRIFFFIIFLCNSIYGMNSTEVAFHSSPNMPNRYFKLAAQSNNLLERSDLPSLKRHKYEEEFITALADISCEGIYAQNKQNQTPVHIALERNNTTIAQRFITVLQSQAEKVWLCSLRDHSGQTLLHITFKKLRQLLEEHRTLCLNNKQLGIENNSLTDHTLCLQAENMSLSQKNSAAKRINDNEVIIQKNCARLAQIEAEEAVNSEQLDRITYLKNELIKFACMILPYSNYLRSDLSASRQTAVSIYNTSLKNQFPTLDAAMRIKRTIPTPSKPRVYQYPLSSIDTKSATEDTRSLSNQTQQQSNASFKIDTTLPSPTGIHEAIKSPSIAITTLSIAAPSLTKKQLQNKKKSAAKKRALDAKKQTEEEAQQLLEEEQQARTQIVKIPLTQETTENLIKNLFNLVSSPEPEKKRVKKLTEILTILKSRKKTIPSSLWINAEGETLLYKALCWEFYTGASKIVEAFPFLANLRCHDERQSHPADYFIDAKKDNRLNNNALSLFLCLYVEHFDLSINNLFPDDPGYTLKEYLEDTGLISSQRKQHYNDDEDDCVAGHEEEFSEKDECSTEEDNEEEEDEAFLSFLAEIKKQEEKQKKIKAGRKVISFSS